jgi:hypothetical protein
LPVPGNLLGLRAVENNLWNSTMHPSTSQMLFRYYCTQRLINALLVQVESAAKAAKALVRFPDKSGVSI